MSGVRFGCTACGGCCHLGNKHVFLTIHDVQRISSKFQLSANEWGQQYCRIRVHHKQNARLLVLRKKANGECIFLAGEKCSIHDVKPLQCRNSPFVSSLIADQAEWQEFKQSCPGFDQDAFVPISEIEIGLQQEQVEMTDTYTTLNGGHAQWKKLLADVPLDGEE